MAFTAADVKNLREMTGVGMMDCKKALAASDGDMDKAVEYLREKGLAASAKKAGRIAAEGMAYAAVIDGVGVVVEVNAETDFVVNMEGEGSSVNLISRSVAKEHSRQLFKSRIIGNSSCQGHSECDAIIMDDASVSAIPELTANDIDANLIHEAAIGKIAGEQLIKLMTLGLTEKEAEEQIVNGFLK